VAVINHGNTPVALTLPVQVKGHAMKLSGRNLGSRDGVAFNDVHVPRSQNIVVAGHTAMIYEL
jgi:hypothetical protein